MSGSPVRLYETREHHGPPGPGANSELTAYFGSMLNSRGSMNELQVG